MNLVKCGKIAVAGLCIASMMAGAAVPALAVSPAGYTSLSQLEESNDANPDTVQAIKNALANIDVTYADETDTISMHSTYETSEVDKKHNIVIPYIFTKNHAQDVYLGLLAVSQDDEGYYYWNKFDILTGDINKSDFTVSYESKNVRRVYATEDKSYAEILSFVTTAEDAENFAKILSYDTVYVRFNGQVVNGTKRSCTALMTDENRQGITDIINLYNLLKSATPEEREAALRG